MSSGLEERFQTLHEIVRAAKQRLPAGEWDYLTGGTETETTMRRNRLAIDTIAFRPPRSTRPRRSSAAPSASR
jgi:isopentenyl diphosphate isomerase/L-lactate dehydrogenase-like FMN-dependent dehydrogenase